MYGEENQEIPEENQEIQIKSLNRNKLLVKFNNGIKMACV